MTDRVEDGLLPVGAPITPPRWVPRARPGTRQPSRPRTPRSFETPSGSVLSWNIADNDVDAHKNKNQMLREETPRTPTAGVADLETHFIHRGNTKHPSLYRNAGSVSGTHTTPRVPTRAFFFYP